VAGSRKKAVASELDALRRHIRKGRLISTWEPVHISQGALAVIAEDIAKGVLIDTAVGRAADLCLAAESELESFHDFEPIPPPPVHQGEAEPRQWKYRFGSFPPLEKAAQWPGWERDLGLVGTYENLVKEALQKAQTRSDEVRKKSVSDMYVSASTLNGLISDRVHETLMGTLEPLWDEAWHLGYAAGKSLATGNPADFSVKYQGMELENFIASEGQHWLGEISRTGLKNINSRSEMIARTEVARAVNMAALQAYADNGVSYKHLLTAPDDTCDICLSAADEGILPLSAIYPGGEPPFHPQCRCVSAPADVDLTPPQGHLGKHEDSSPHEHQEDENRLCWMLLRARDEEGKYRFLLQQRDDGSWGMPGGTAHIGEEPWAATTRETTEEIGDLPFIHCVGTFHHAEDDGKFAYVYLCDAPYFHPKLNGSTPDETQGTGWFRRKEIDSLNLTPKFREDWDQSIHLRDHVTKNVQMAVNESGEQLFLTPAAQELQATGSRWPYPHRADGTEDPEDEHYNQADGEMGASEPPGWHDMSDVIGQTRVYPRGTEDEEYPKRGREPNKPASRFPDQGGQLYPQTTNGGPQSPRSGIPKGMNPPKLGDIPQHGMRLVVGSTPAETPDAYEPRAPEPEVPYDPEDSVPVLTEEGNAFLKPGGKKGRGGPSDYSDPNPVDAEHVYLQLAKNFPPKAIEWVRRARWIGPVNVTWERIDSDGVETWAASHQPEKVSEFARMIRAHSGRVAPSVAIQDDDSPKAIIIDGHHRALARKKMNMPILCYIGMIDPRDRKSAEETHSQQIHGGADPKNE
jgi:8-oxo-dGTP pyrophosphatase MutT (NUDIX family)